MREDIPTAKRIAPGENGLDFTGSGRIELVRPKLKPCGRPMFFLVIYFWSCPSKRPYFRISGQTRAVAMTTKMVPIPPETTANTGPSK